MAISKITLNGQTQMDVTGKTVTSGTMLNGTTALKNDGTDITGSIAYKTSSDLTVSDATVTAPAGYYESAASKTIPDAEYEAHNSFTFRTQNSQRKCDIEAWSTIEVPGYVGSGTIVAMDDSYNAVAANTTISPTTSSQTVGGANWIMEGPLTVAAMPSGSVTAPTSISGTSATVSTGTNMLTLSKTVSVTPNVTTAGYVSSGTAGNASVSLTANVNTRSSSDLTVSDDTVTAPAGYYSSSASKAVAAGTAGTPTASKGTVSNHAISVTPSVTNVTGYITGGTKTGTAVSVSASELVSGTKSITSSGTTDVTNYASASVAAGSATTPATTITANPSISVSSGGLITATASATKSITPTVGAGYVSSGTAGTVTVSGSNTSQLSTQAAQTIHPSTVEQSVTAGVYLTGDQTIAPVTTTNLNANNILRGVTVEVGDSEDPDRVASVQGVLDVDVVVDPTLSNAGQAADAKATGDKIITLENDITGLNAYNILDLCAKTNQTFQGVKYEWNRDGSCNVSQTATATSFNNIFISQTSLPSGIHAGDILDIQYSSTNVYLYLYDYSTSSPVVIWGGKTGTRIKIPTTCTGMIIRLWVANGTAVGNPGETVKPIVFSANRYCANKPTIYGGSSVYSNANSINETCTVFAWNSSGSSSISNVPYFPCYIETVVVNDSIALQKAYPYQTGTNGVMIRTKVSGTWGSWTAV